MGIFWDHKGSISLSDSMIVYSDQGVYYSHPFCIFDLVGERRIINISELLSVNDSLEFARICNGLKEYKDIAINIDYIPNKNSLVSLIFFRKRLCQIYYVLQQTLPESQIVIQISQAVSSEWKAFQQMVYQ